MGAFEFHALFSWVVLGNELRLQSKTILWPRVPFSDAALVDLPLPRLRRHPRQIPFPAENHNDLDDLPLQAVEKPVITDQKLSQIGQIWEFRDAAALLGKILQRIDGVNQPLEQSNGMGLRVLGGVLADPWTSSFTTLGDA